MDNQNLFISLNSNRISGLEKPSLGAPNWQPAMPLRRFLELPTDKRRK
jgi:hypothetical protein